MNITETKSLRSTNFPPESEKGNVEYKLKIINPSKQRLEHLITQMKWRLREGQGEAVYEIGIEDNGRIRGVAPEELISSIDTLKEMAAKLGASVNILRENTLESNLRVAEVLVRKIPEGQHCIEIGIAIVGNERAGKSTLLGVLTHADLDNGRGKARLNLLRHLHEIKTGQTSSISHEILGFNSLGEPINYGNCSLMTAEEICEVSTKLITFIDLAGHKKYINTTVQGISGYCPHYAMLVISSDRGVVGTTQEHLTIAVALQIPFFVVITKTDLMHQEPTIGSLKYCFKQIGIDKVPFIVENIDDIILAAKFQRSQLFVPIFCVSNVSGDGHYLLIRFLHLLSPEISLQEKEILDQEPVKFHIDEHCHAGEIGQVLGGLLVRGVITEGTQLKLGPQDDGSFFRVTVKSIHRNKAPCRVVKSGQSAALRLDIPIPSLRNGMVLLSTDVDASGCFYFQANICLLFPSSALYVGSETIAHINNIRQTVVIVGIFTSRCINLNETASVLFKFKQHPEYVQKGQRLLLREGISKAIGEIVQVFPLDVADL